MTYETAQLVESGNEEGLIATPAHRARPWRRVGLALAAISAIGVVMGTMTLRSRPVSRFERLQRLHRGLLKAFSARSLAEASDMKTRLEFLFAAEGQEDPDAMSIEAKVQTSDADIDHVEIKAVFAAKEGKGPDLVADFKKLKDALGSEIGLPSDLVNIQEGGEDEAVVTVTIPKPPNPEEAESEMDEALKDPPTFTASLSFGRTIAEMHAHIDEAFALVPNGIKGHVDAAFAHSLFKAAEDEAGVSSDNLPDEFLMMSALSSVKASHEIRYRAGDPPPLIFSRMHTMKKEVDEFAKEFAEGPPAILKPIAKLADFADGLTSLELRGLPHKFEIILTGKNVHVTPLLKDFIGDLEGAEEGEDAAPDPAPEDAADDTTAEE